jgi:hypothetical protein
MDVSALISGVIRQVPNLQALENYTERELETFIDDTNPSQSTHLTLQITVWYKCIFEFQT